MGGASIGMVSLWAGLLRGRGLIRDLAQAPEQRACPARSRRAALSAASSARGQPGSRLVEVRSKVGPLLCLLHLCHLARSSEGSPWFPASEESTGPLIRVFSGQTRRCEARSWERQVHLGVWPPADSDGPQRDVAPRRGLGRRPPQSLSGRRLRGPAVLAVPGRGGRRWEGARVPRVGTARPADLPARCFRVPLLPRGLLTARSSLQLPLLVRLFPPSETLCTFSGESLEIPVTRCLYFHKAGAGEVALVENLGQCAHTLLIL